MAVRELEKLERFAKSLRAWLAREKVKHAHSLTCKLFDKGAPCPSCGVALAWSLLTHEAKFADPKGPLDFGAIRERRKDLAEALTALEKVEAVLGPQDAIRILRRQLPPKREGRPLTIEDVLIEALVSRGGLADVAALELLHADPDEEQPDADWVGKAIAARKKRDKPAPRPPKRTVREQLADLGLGKDATWDDVRRAVNKLCGSVFRWTDGDQQVSSKCELPLGHLVDHEAPYQGGRVCWEHSPTKKSARSHSGRKLI